jgi:hypothetical protein
MSIAGGATRRCRISLWVWLRAEFDATSALRKRDDGLARTIEARGPL